MIMNISKLFVRRFLLLSAGVLLKNRDSRARSDEDEPASGRQLLADQELACSFRQVAIL